MKERTPSTTAISSALHRASHLVLDADPKIFRDDFALALSGCADEVELGAVLRQRYEPIEQKLGRDFTEFFLGTVRSALTVRSCFTEEALEETLQRGIDQYVLLGAGLDSFALRRRDLAHRLGLPRKGPRFHQRSP